MDSALGLVDGTLGLVDSILGLVVGTLDLDFRFLFKTAHASMVFSGVCYKIWGKNNKKHSQYTSKDKLILAICHVVIPCTTWFCNYV